MTSFGVTAATTLRDPYTTCDVAPGVIVVSPPRTATASRPFSQPRVSILPAGTAFAPSRTVLGVAMRERRARRREGQMRDGRGGPDHTVRLVREVVDDGAAASADVGDGEGVGSPRRPYRSHRAVDRRVVDAVPVDDVEDEAIPGVDDICDPQAVGGPGDRDDASAGGT